MTAAETADAVGFCSKCGIVRQDTADGVPITDCRCTALKRGHAAGCLYVISVSSPIDVGGSCKHGIYACEQCDCDCVRRTKEK